MKNMLTCINIKKYIPKREYIKCCCIIKTDVTKRLISASNSEKSYVSQCACCITCTTYNNLLYKIFYISKNTENLSPNLIKRYLKIQVKYQISKFQRCHFNILFIHGLFE